MKRSLKYMFCFALLLLSLSGGAPAAQSPAVQMLIGKAQSLEGRGRSDLAAQAWQQILATDPNQQDALAALARYARRNGKADEANSYLARLRKLNPNHPALNEIESLPVVSEQRSRLDQAARLAAAQQYAEAMAIYRQVFGETPPPGGWAIAYYETEASVPGGWEKATASLRKLCNQYPAVDEYRLSLGRLLTYRPATRSSGITMLESISEHGPLAGKARQAWRQALSWEKSNPAALASIQQYLTRYSDPELKAAADSLSTEVHRADGVHARPGGHDELLAYEALKAGRLADAEKHFGDALREDPNASAALSGMGYVRMKQQDFADAAKYLENARRQLPHDRALAEAVETATFWKSMQQGTKDLAANDLDGATTSYKAALALRPKSPDAMFGLAGALLRARQYDEAGTLLERLTALKPNDPNVWRQLIDAKFGSGGAKGALEVLNTLPKDVSDQLNSRVDFLAMSAGIYAEAGRDAESKALFRKLTGMAGGALDELPPSDQVQVAGLMLRFGQGAEAAAAMQKLIDSDPKNIDAWEVLLGALVQSNRQRLAVAALQQIPDSVYNQGLHRPAFLRAVASIEAANGKLDEAEEALTKLSEAEKANGPGASLATRLQLARVYLQQGHANRANELLSALADSNPDNPDVWKAYTAMLHERHRDAEAIAVTSRIPHRVLQHLANDSDYVSTIAAAQSATGNQDGALRLLRESIARSREEGAVVPVRLNLQLAWMLLNVPEDQSELYSILEQTGRRNDITAEGTKELAQLWTTWILRAAESANSSGDLDRALALLRQGSRMFPRDSRIQRSLAGYLLKSGDNARALAVYKNWGLRGAEPNDYAGAIGAAMTAHDIVYANAWLQDGLTKFPSSPVILNLAGKQAAAHGDYKKAKLYWKEALAVSPRDQKNELPSLLLGTDPKDNGGNQSQDMRALLLGATPQEQSGAPEQSGYGDAAPAAPALGGMSSSLRFRSEPDREAVTSPSFAVANRSHHEPLVLASYNADATAASNSYAPEPELAAQPAGNGLFTGKAPQPENASLEVAPAPDSAPVIQDEINAVEGRNTPYLGNDDSVQSRNGSSGFDKMLIEQANIEASTTIGDQIRLTIIAKPMHVESGPGEADPNSKLAFGTLTPGSAFSTQVAGGIGADAQISGQQFGLHFGLTPEGFLVRNFTAGLRFNPGNGPISFVVDRDNIRDSFLSYAGSRDPGSNQVWGGVVANSAAILGNWGDERSGFYARVGYQLITGRQVETNHRIDATAGRYWRVFARKDGALTLGLNVSGMHYDENLRYFTLGQGGYFSPQRYFLVNAPLRWTGVYHKRLQYLVAASLGVQHFNEDESAYYPTQPLLQSQLKEGGYYPGQVSTGANYNFEAKVSYQLTPNWFVGGYVGANNARYYSSQTVGFFLKYSFEPRPLLQESVVPSVPDWKGQQPFLLY